MHARPEDLIAARLRRLPAFNAPPLRIVFPVAASQPAPARERRRWAPLAAAASVALLALSVTRILVHDPAGSESLAVAPVGSEPGNQQLQQLVSRSQQLEALLDELPPRPAVERVATSATIEALQSRIELVDTQLMSPEELPDSRQLTQLWGERVWLMNSLVGMRYAEATRAAWRPDDP